MGPPTLNMNVSLKHFVLTNHLKLLTFTKLTKFGLNTYGANICGKYHVKSDEQIKIAAAKSKQYVSTPIRQYNCTVPEFDSCRNAS